MAATVVIVDDGPYALNGDIAPTRLAGQVSAVAVVRTLCSELGKAGGERHSVGAIGGCSGTCLLAMGSDADCVVPAAQNSSPFGCEGGHRSGAGGERGGRNNACPSSMSSKWMGTALRKARLMLKSSGAVSQRVLLFCCSPVADAGSGARAAAQLLRDEGIGIDAVTFGDANVHQGNTSDASNGRTTQTNRSHKPLLSEMMAITRPANDHQDTNEDDVEPILSGGMWRIGALSREIDVTANMRPAAVRARQQNARLHLAAAPPEWRSAVLRLARPMRVPSRVRPHVATDRSGTLLQDTIAKGMRDLNRQQKVQNSIAGCRPNAKHGLGAKIVRELTLMRPRITRIEKTPSAASTSLARKGDSSSPLPLMPQGERRLVGIHFERERIGAPIVNATRVADSLLRSGVVLTEAAPNSSNSSSSSDESKPVISIEVQTLVPARPGFPLPRKLKAGERGELSVVRASCSPSSAESVAYVVFRPSSTGIPTDVAAVLPCGSCQARVVECAGGGAVCAIQISCMPKLSRRHTLISGKRTCLYFFTVLGTDGIGDAQSLEAARRACTELNRILQCPTRSFSFNEDVFSCAASDLLPANAVDVWGGAMRTSIGRRSYTELSRWEDEEANGEGGGGAEDDSGTRGVVCQSTNGEPNVTYGQQQKQQQKHAQRFTVRDIERVLVGAMEGPDLSISVQALWTISGSDQARIYGHGLVSIPRTTIVGDKIRDDDDDDDIFDDDINGSLRRQRRRRRRQFEEDVADLPRDVAAILCSSDDESEEENENETGSARFGWLVASSVGEAQWACIANFSLNSIEKKVALDASVSLHVHHSSSSKKNAMSNSPSSSSSSVFSSAAAAAAGGGGTVHSITLPDGRGPSQSASRPRTTTLNARVSVDSATEGAVAAGSVLVPPTEKKTVKKKKEEDGLAPSKSVSIDFGTTSAREGSEASPLLSCTDILSSDTACGRRGITNTSSGSFTTKNTSGDCGSQTRKGAQVEGEDETEPSRTGTPAAQAIGENDRAVTFQSLRRLLQD